MSLFHRRAHPNDPMPCVVCGHIVDDPEAGLTVMCPDCTTRVKDAVARQSRPYRDSQRGCSRD